MRHVDVATAIDIVALALAVVSIVVAGVSMHYVNKASRAVNEQMARMGSPERVAILTPRTIWEWLRG